MDERVALFKRRYPGSKITVYKLRKLYAKKKIKKKVLRIGKVPKVATMMEIAMEAAELSQNIQMALERRLRII